jgi:hypothetical protein
LETFNLEKLMNLLKLGLFAVSLFILHSTQLTRCFASDSVAHDKHGRVYGLIYTDVFTRINSEVKSSAFEMKRIYIGYEKDLSDAFEANIKIDIGSPDDLSPFSIVRRYAYFKNAYVKYHHQKVSVLFGIIDLQQFKLQEKIWEHRYIEKSFADLYRFGSSADLGAQMNYKWNNWFSTDITIMNGDGYTQLQHQSNYKYGGGLTFHPVKKFVTRGYFDFSQRDISQSTLTFFAGYHNKGSLSAGLEYNHKFNQAYEEDHQRYGYSGYLSWYFIEKWQAFGRYDHVFSNKINGEANPWNISNDGSKIIGGIEFSPISSIKLALNYQDWVPYAANEENQQYIYLNVEISF